MPWTPPTEKHKTQRVDPDSCSDGKCIIRERFNALAEPRIVVPVGYMIRCGGHDDGQPLPLNMIQGFDGQWRSRRVHDGWEIAWYAWVAWHEFMDRLTVEADTLPYDELAIEGMIELGFDIQTRADFDLAATQITGDQFLGLRQLDIAETRVKLQNRMAEGVRLAGGLDTLNRLDTDDGPWTPDARPEPSQVSRDTLARSYGWHQRDNALASSVLEGMEDEDPDLTRDNELLAWWFEGVGELRILHVDTGGQLSPPQRKRVGDATALQFGPDRLIWEG